MSFTEIRQKQQQQKLRHQLLLLQLYSRNRRLLCFHFFLVSAVHCRTQRCCTAAAAARVTHCQRIMSAGGQEPRKRNQEKNEREERKIGHCFLLVLFAGCQGGRLEFCFTACPTVADKVHIGIHIQFTESCSWSKQQFQSLSSYSYQIAPAYCTIFLLFLPAARLKKTLLDWQFSWSVWIGFANNNAGFFFCFIFIIMVFLSLFWVVGDLETFFREVIQLFFLPASQTLNLNRFWTLNCQVTAFYGRDDEK